MTRHTDDYADAHLRHWEDAELLFDNARWPNADQLYGFSAECGLKAIMKDLGIPITKMHVNELWQRYLTAVEGLGETLYIMDGEPFRDWSTNDRYAHHSRIDKVKAKRHRDGAETVYRMLENTADKKP